MTNLLIVVRGCDDETRIITHYDGYDFRFFEDICRRVALASTYSCQPDISYYTIPPEAYEKYIRWKSLKKKFELNDFIGNTEEETEFYNNHYDEYWLERQVIEPMFIASKFRKEVLGN